MFYNTFLLIRDFRALYSYSIMQTIKIDQRSFLSSYSSLAYFFIKLAVSTQTHKNRPYAKHVSPFLYYVNLSIFYQLLSQSNTFSTLYIVTKINLHIKSAAITVTTISFLVYLPVKIAISTYAIAPTPIPFEIE